MKIQNWSLPVWGQIGAAIVLLVSGIVLAIFQEQAFKDQQIKSIGEQAEILAASATASIIFEDRAAAQEYVGALRVNFDLLGAAIYSKSGQRLAAFERRTRLPDRLTRAQLTVTEDHIDYATLASQNGAPVGIVLLRAVSEPPWRHYSRYAGLLLLVTMGALVIVVLSVTQQQLSRRAKELAEVNAKLQAEMEERQKTEIVLRQSQKMEAIGQLSGGIAHDFNNLIMIVKGNLQLMKRKLGGNIGPVGVHISSADEALDRAAHLTQRILAFSRQQPLTPQRVHLGTLTQGLADLLRHSVGEKVETILRLKGAWFTLCDINQMENVILNLAINARDAMPEGGRIIIETGDVTLRETPRGAEGQNFVPGDYARLAIIDTGAGMTEEVRSKAVDPFFTTKPQGKGTGLGLSMSFGFVRQSGGYLLIESSPAAGTTVTILMPREVGKNEQ